MRIAPFRDSLRLVRSKAARLRPACSEAADTLAPEAGATAQAARATLATKRALQAPTWPLAGRFGIEVETIRRAPYAAAAAMPPHLQVRHSDIAPGDYSTWKLVRDNTLSDLHNNAELVSPPLRYEQMPDVHAAIAGLRAAGADVDKSTSVHIHLDARELQVQDVIHLAQLVHHFEPVTYQMLGVTQQRRKRFCAPIQPGFIKGIQHAPPKSLEDLAQAWYKPWLDSAGSAEPEQLSRRRARSSGLNLNSLFEKNTVELRYFEGTLDGARIHHYVDFAHALISASRRGPVDTAAAAPTLAGLFAALKLDGPAFADARAHFALNYELQAWVNQAPVDQRGVREAAARVILAKPREATVPETVREAETS